MSEENQKPDIGELVISEEVIASIAQNAARDVDGVAGFSPRKADAAMLRAINTNKFVSVVLGDNDVKLCVSIIVKPGFNIQSVSGEVQRAVKAAVQNMTGRVVTKINITIAGLGGN